MSPGPVYELPPDRGRGRKKKYPLWVRIIGAGVCLLVLVVILKVMTADRNTYHPKSVYPTGRTYPTSPYAPYPNPPAAEFRRQGDEPRP